MKQLILSAAMMLAGTASANIAPSPNPSPRPAPAPMEVSFQAGLNVSVCNESAGMCLSTSIAGPDVKLALNPMNNEPSHWRGLYVTVSEQDYQRFIGIITVDRYEFQTDNGATTAYYNFSAEILGARGTEAQMNLSVSDPSKLINGSLRGGERRMGGSVYIPYLSIGPAVNSCQSNPGSSPNCPIPVPEPGAKWNVIKGTLQ